MPAIRLQPAALLPLAAPLAITVIGFSLFQHLNNANIPIALPASWAPDYVPREAAARYWVGTTFIILLAACLGTACYCAYGIKRYVSATGDVGVLFVTVVLAAAVALVVTGGGDPLYLDLGKGVFAATLFGYFAQVHLSQSLLPNIIIVSNLAAIGAATLVAVAVSILVPAPPPEGASGAPPAKTRIDAAADALAAQNAELKYLLFCAAAVLLLGLALMKAWGEWPLAFFDRSSAEAAAFRGLVSAVIGFQATLFVLILAAIFVPAWLRLHKAARALGELELLRIRQAGSGGIAMRERWLGEKGLVPSLGELCQRVFAIVSPYLAAPLLSLIESATKTGGLAALLGLT